MFSARSTIRRYFYVWRESGWFEAIHQLLFMAARDIEGREGNPTAGVIDFQSVKTMESGGVSGFDAGKKIKGRKRHKPCILGLCKHAFCTRSAFEAIKSMRKPFGGRLSLFMAIKTAARTGSSSNRTWPI